VLVLVPALMLIAMGIGLPLGWIDGSMWWLVIPPTGLLALAIMHSGGYVGEPNAAKFTTSLKGAQIRVSHRTQPRGKPTNTPHQRGP
jgi:hypothetical protein